MMKIFKIFQNALRRSKLLIVISLICGLLLCGLNVMVGNMFDENISSIPIGVRDMDDSVTTREFTDYLEDELNMDPMKDSDIDRLNSQLIEKHISAIVEIPEGFEKSLLAGKVKPFEMSYTNDYENAAFIDGYMESYVESLEIIALSAEGDADKFHELLNENDDNKIDIKTVSVDKDKMKKIAEQNGLDLTLGFFLMISFILALGFANMIFTDRKDGTFNRIKITSINTIQYVAGMCLSSIVCSMLIVVPFFVYLGIKGTAIHIPVGASMFICLLYALIVVAMALFVAMILGSKNSIMAALVGLTTVTCILGGAFFPLDMSPQFLQQIAQITPQFWFMDAIRILLDKSSGDWWVNGGILTMFAVLFFVLAGVRFAGTKTQVQ